MLDVRDKTTAHLIDTFQTSRSQSASFFITQSPPGNVKPTSFPSTGKNAEHLLLSRSDYQSGPLSFLFVLGF